MSRLKFTIHGFQQSKLIEHGLDNNDALVMAVVRDMYSSVSVDHKIIDGDRYIWVNQTALSEYVPIIGALRTFQRIFKKLTDKGIFESRVVNGRNGKTGKYFYLKPSKLLEDLTEYVAIAQGFDQPPNCHMNNRQNGVRSSGNLSDDQPPICRNKDTPTNDSSTNDSISSYDREELLQKWNEVAPVKMRKIVAGGPIDKSIKARITDYGIDGLYEAIDRIPKSSFLSGKVVNQKTGKLWKMTFSWFIGPQNFEKVYNGNYPEDEVPASDSEFGNGGYGKNVIPKFDFESGGNYDG